MRKLRKENTAPNRVRPKADAIPRDWDTYYRELEEAVLAAMPAVNASVLKYEESLRSQRTSSI